MSFELKNNNVTQDPRLDRIPQWDPNNSNYPMRRLTSRLSGMRSWTWAVGINMKHQLWLNQGQEGACVGFSLAHELAAKPIIIPGIDADYAHKLYKGAQQNDEWPGEDYEGSSVLGGAKFATAKGLYQSYAWTKDAMELARSVAYKGPAVLGINWYEGMYNTDSLGRLKVEGEIVGGHAILCNGFNLAKNAFLLHNSWGPEWGERGTGWVSMPDMQRLLNEDGEACLPLREPYDKAVIW